MILYVTRRFLPSIGGMARYSHELTTALCKLTELKIVAWRGSQAFLPWFFLKGFLQSAYWLLTKPIEIVHLGDALMSPLGWLLKVLFKKPVVSTAHGLDLTFDFKPYQWIVPAFLRRLDGVICVSRYTQQEAVRRGVPQEKTVVVPNGISMQNRQCKENDNASRRVIEALLPSNLDGQKILLTAGRLVERKGIDQFILHALPKILAQRDDVVYLVVGEGKHRKIIERAIASLALRNKVFLLGRVDDAMLQMSYKAAHIFVMPNVPVAGDVEGFGLVALEASSAGLPVVASNLEGLCDAIVHGQNGLLVDYRDPNSFAEAILGFLRDENMRREFGARGRAFTLRSYGWDAIAKKYLEVYKEFL